MQLEQGISDLMRNAAILASVTPLATVFLSACQSAPPRTPVQAPPLNVAYSGLTRSEQSSAPPPAPGPTFDIGRSVTAPRVAHTTGLTAAQIDAMFDAAIEQTRPFEGKTAICAGMQGLNDRTVVDAPVATISRLSATLGLPAVPASQCGFDIEPFVTATGAKAMLYTVRIEARDVHGILTFWAVSTYGNIGATGTQYRLVRNGGRWKPVTTGRFMMS